MKTATAKKCNKNGAAAATATISKFERNRTITKYGTATATIST